MKLILFLLTPALSWAAEPGIDATRLAQIAPRMKSFTDRGDVAGAVTLVQRNGKTVHLDAVGFQDIEKKLPMKTDSIFQVMSMTKPVTAVAIMMLAEEGRLSITDNVEKHLPEFKGQWMVTSRDGDKEIKLARPSRIITIRDLLTHTSGMPTMGPAATATLYQKFDRTLPEAVLIFAQLPLLFEPGSKFQYSNTGIATLGRIVEVVGDMPFEQFVGRRIFAPLGMKDSFFFPKPEHYARLAQVYQPGPDGKLKSGDDYPLRKGSKYSMPEGGMYSTAEDMAKFYQAMLDGGKPLLARSSLEAMIMNQTGDILGANGAWGLGWTVGRGTARPGYGHGGAFGTLGWVDPATKTVKVFMVQKFGGPVDDIRNAFMNIATAAITE